MIIDILIIIAGIALVLVGADKLTDGAVGLAQRMNVPQIVIGLTIVAMGTSMPEFCVSLVSALKGTPDLAVGNIVGSNIFNVLLIVGISAIVAPMTISKSTVKRDIPFSVVASCLLLGLGIDGELSRLDCAIFTALFLFFMAQALRSAKQGQAEEQKNEPIAVWKASLFLLLGIAGLIFGSNIFVSAASRVAASLGVSEAVIGLTIVAGGTSLPELATSVVAARKGNSSIAIGNVIGSNVFNVFMILGITGLVHPMRIMNITGVDYGVMTLGVFLLWLFSFTKYTIAKWEGAVLSSIYVVYMWYLIMNAI